MALAPPAPCRAQGSHPDTGAWEEIGGCGGGHGDLPKARLNGGVITCKCARGTCLKRVGKGGEGGGVESSENKAGGEMDPPPTSGARQQWGPPLHPAPLNGGAQSPACRLCSAPCNN